MKRAFLLSLPNGLFGDPLVVLRLRWIPRVVLLDAGSTDRLAPRTLLEVSDVLVSHAHVDHVFGLARLLRIRLGRKERGLRIFGPAGFAEQVAHHLRFYTWNLVDALPIELELIEIDDAELRHYELGPTPSLEAQLLKRTPRSHNAPIHQDEQLAFFARSFVHNSTASLGWRVREHESLHVDRAGLAALDLPPGPWIATLKDALRRNVPPETPLALPDGTARPLGELAHALLTRREGDEVAYLTDIDPSPHQLDEARSFVQGARHLAVECHFAATEEGLASEHGHLTASDAGALARDAGVTLCHPLHLSKRYEDDPEPLLAELCQAAHPVRVVPLPSGPANDAR